MMARKGIINPLPKSTRTKSYDWELVFTDPLNGSAEPYESSLLTVNGEKLRCLPDRVLRHKITGSVLIIENKVTRNDVDVPLCGWANLSAQLWCYSWIDKWIDAPEVILLGSIYKWSAGKLQPSNITPRSLRSDKTLNEQCSKLFEAFGGYVNLDFLKRKYGRNEKLRRLF